MGVKMEKEWVTKVSDIGLEDKLEQEANLIEKVFGKHKIESSRILIGESNTLFYLTGDSNSLDPFSSEFVKDIRSCGRQVSRPIQYYGSDEVEILL